MDDQDHNQTSKYEENYEPFIKYLNLILREVNKENYPSGSTKLLQLSAAI